MSRKRPRRGFSEPVPGSINDNNCDFPNKKSKIDANKSKQLKPLKTLNPLNQTWYPFGVSDVDGNNHKNWVSATSIKNYLLNDPIIDWLDMYYPKYGFNDVPNSNSNSNSNVEEQNTKMPKTPKNIKSNTDDKSHMDVLFKNGLIFEDAVVKDIKQKYPDKTIHICQSFNDVTRDKFNLTVGAMMNGIPIIFQAVLFNDENKTFGVADLVIRSDYINQLFGANQISKSQMQLSAPKLGRSGFHYRVIDIKWSTLHLCADGKLIRNDARIPAYKGQLTIYNCALGHIQGFYPNEAYILGHSWKHETCGNKYEGHNCFDLLGHIDYSDFDKKYIEKTYLGVQWIRNLRHHGLEWSLIPPSLPELYPNMSNKNDAPWSDVKSIIADKIHELTQLWMVGPKNRQIGHSNDIYKWSDKRCRANKLGINGKKIGPILDEIIKINQSDVDIVRPPNIKNNIMNWQEKHELDFYIDFETLNQCFVNSPTNLNNNKSESNIIFLIGIGYIEDDEWQYKSFQINTLDNKLMEEKIIIDEWISFINDKVTEYREKYDDESVVAKLFHWSHAERTSLNLANIRHKHKWDYWFDSVSWIDLCKIFQNEPIVVKGSLKFKLKDIAKSMYNHDLIQTTWDSANFDDGLAVMINAVNYYKNPDMNTMTNIKKYNEVDCKVMWEITEYLRINHT